MSTISTILNQQYAVIQTEWLRYQNNPYDADRVHDLRVAIRTLRGLIKFLKRQISKPVFDNLDETLSQAAQLFGPLRDWDVLVMEAGEFVYLHPRNQATYRNLFQTLYEQRNRKMQATLKPEVQRKIAGDLLRVKAQLKELKFNDQHNWPKLIAHEFNRRDHKLMAQYRNLDFDDYVQVHHVRKRAKTLRYAATYFSALRPKHGKKILRRAKNIQDICGTLTDAHINEGQLRQLAAKISDTDQQAILLQLAQVQRQRYRAEREAIVGGLVNV